MSTTGPDVIEVQPPAGETPLQRVLRLRALSAKIRESERALDEARRVEDEACRAYDQRRSNASFAAYEAAVQRREEVYAVYQERLKAAETASGRARLVEVERGIGAQLARLSRGERP